MAPCLCLGNWMNSEMEHGQKVRHEKEGQEFTFKDDEPEMSEHYPGNNVLKSKKLNAWM